MVALYRPNGKVLCMIADTEISSLLSFDGRVEGPGCCASPPICCHASHIG